MLKDKFCLSSRVSTEFHRYDLNFIAVAETDLNSAYDIEIWKFKSCNFGSTVYFINCNVRRWIGDAEK